MIFIVVLKEIKTKLHNSVISISKEVIVEGHRKMYCSKCREKENLINIDINLNCAESAFQMAKIL